MTSQLANIPQEVCAEHLSGFLDNFGITGFSETCRKWYAALAHIIETRRKASLLRLDPGYLRAPALFLRSFNVDKGKNNVTIHARVINVEKIVLQQTHQHDPLGVEVSFSVTLHDNTPGPNNIMKGTFWNWHRHDYDYLKSNVNRMFIIKGLKLKNNNFPAHAHNHVLTFSCVKNGDRGNCFGQYFLSETPRLYAPRSKRTREGDDTL